MRTCPAASAPRPASESIDKNVCTAKGRAACNGAHLTTRAAEKALREPRCATTSRAGSPALPARIAMLCMLIDEALEPSTPPRVAVAKASKPSTSSIDEAPASSRNTTLTRSLRRVALVCPSGGPAGLAGRLRQALAKAAAPVSVSVHSTLERDVAMCSTDAATQRCCVDAHISVGSASCCQAESRSSGMLTREGSHRAAMHRSARQLRVMVSEGNAGLGSTSAWPTRRTGQVGALHGAHRRALDLEHACALRCERSNASRSVLGRL